MPAIALNQPLCVCALLADETVLTFQFTIFQPVKEKSASPSGMKILNEKESHRDIPPDKPSAAQHVTGVPASGSHLVQGKRSLPVPSKVRRADCRWAVAVGKGPGGLCIHGACLLIEVKVRKIEDVAHQRQLRNAKKRPALRWGQGAVGGEQPSPLGSGSPWFCMSLMRSSPWRGRDEVSKL